MNTEPRYRRNTDLNTEIDGAQGYVELRSGSWAVLNEPARAIWESLAVPRTADEVVAVLLEQYRGEQETVRRDVRLALADLEGLGLVRIDDGP